MASSASCAAAESFSASSRWKTGSKPASGHGRKMGGFGRGRSGCGVRRCMNLARARILRVCRPWWVERHLHLLHHRSRSTSLRHLRHPELQCLDLHLHLHLLQPYPVTESSSHPLHSSHPVFALYISHPHRPCNSITLASWVHRRLRRGSSISAARDLTRNIKI